MSKLLLTQDYNQLLQEGVPQDLIKIILSTKYPEEFNLENIKREMKDENELIRRMMLEKGFRPMSELYSQDNINACQETEETKEDQDAKSESETETEAECQTGDERYY